MTVACALPRRAGADAAEQAVRHHIKASESALAHRHERESGITERIEMTVLLRAAVLTLFATSAIAAGKPAHGHLMLIGGGDKPRAAMEKLIELAGGKDAPIVVIP